MKSIKFLTYALAGVIFASSASCSMEYLEDPNNPTVPPTYGLMNNVQKTLLDDTRDEWFSGRQMLLWVQYWNQTAYTEEDRYQYRETTNQGGWDDLYGNAQDLKDIITFNTDEATKNDMAKYGPNENQIAAARIMLVYTYLQAVELWGDVPYWSYAGDNASFQANSVKETGANDPSYAKQSDIYPDMLKELKEASEMITGSYVMDGDNFYNGNAEKWKKFANSLRLRIANRVKAVYPGAATHITEALAAGVFVSNDDNAGVTYEANAVNGAPMYRAFVVNAREDFSPSASFVTLLEGNSVGVFNGVADPRLDVYVGLNADSSRVGVPLTGGNAEVNKFKWWSYPGDAILAADKTLYYMEYSEVCFIQAEQNGWDQAWYVKGVEASMEKWGVAEADIAAYVATLPAASQETVMMEKYKALYMQPMEAWSEYRRTGFPNTLYKPYVPYTYTWKIGEGATLRDTTATFEFQPLGGLTDMPTRNKYLLNEESVNNAKFNEAISNMGGNAQTTKLWWQP